MTKEKTFTQRAEKIFSEKIDELFDKELYSLKGNAQEVINYLTNKCNMMTFGYALRRYIREQFDESLPEVSEEVVEEFLEASLSGYYKVINDLCKESGIRYSKQDAKRWLLGKTCKRETTLKKISFIFKMDSNKVQEFLTNTLGEQGYNFRDYKEVIYYYCHTHDLGWTKAEELLQWYEALTENSTKEPTNHLTEHFKDIVKNTLTEKDLLDFLRENKEDFGGYSRTNQETFKKLYGDVIEILNLIYYKEDVGYPKKDESTIYFSEPLNGDNLEKILLDSIPRAEKGEGEKTQNEFISIKKSKLYDLLTNMPKRDKMDKISKGKRNPSRKELIWFSFFRLTLLASGYEEVLGNEKFGEEAKKLTEVQKKEPIESMASFKDEVDDMLQENGMGSLYIPNRFDNLILLALCSARPYETFTSIIEESFDTSN